MAVCDSAMPPWRWKNALESWPSCNFPWRQGDTLEQVKFLGRSWRSTENLRAALEQDLRADEDAQAKQALNNHTGHIAQPNEMQKFQARDSGLQIKQAQNMRAGENQQQALQAAEISRVNQVQSVQFAETSQKQAQQLLELGDSEATQQRQNVKAVEALPPNDAQNLQAGESDQNLETRAGGGEGKVDQAVASQSGKEDDAECVSMDEMVIDEGTNVDGVCSRLAFWKAMGLKENPPRPPQWHYAEQMGNVGNDPNALLGRSTDDVWHPHLPACYYDLRGRCNDPECFLQHFRDEVSSKSAQNMEDRLKRVKAEVPIYNQGLSAAEDVSFRTEPLSMALPSFMTATRPAQAAKAAEKGRYHEDLQGGFNEVLNALERKETRSVAEVIAASLEKVGNFHETLKNAANPSLVTSIFLKNCVHRLMWQRR